VQQRRDFHDPRPQVEDERVTGHVVDLALDGHRLAREALGIEQQAVVPW